VSVGNRRKLIDEETARLAVALEVDAVYFVDEPAWYLRLSLPFHLNWRREVAFELGLLVVGLLVGFALGRA
jgi:hypothetical protein